MYKVVSVSRNTSLLLRRNEALGMAGFTVISPRYPIEAPALALQRHADAFVVGESVPRAERKQLIKKVRKVCPNCLVVFVHAVPGVQTEPLADISIDVSRGLEPLITVLSERLSRSERYAA